MNLSIAEAKALGVVGPLVYKPKFLSLHSRSLTWMVVILCNDAEIEVSEGEICQICGCELEEFDEVTGTGIHGYYHWICVRHADA
jgi:hypothetical protein